MRKQLPLWVGLMTGGLSVVWLLSHSFDVALFRELVTGLALFLFKSREAGFFLYLPVNILCAALFGTTAAGLCWLWLSYRERKKHKPKSRIVKDEFRPPHVPYS